MLIVVLLWLVLFLIFFITGFSIVQLLNKLRADKGEDIIKFEEYFFLGFSGVSIAAGSFSVFVPIGSAFLGIACILVLVLFILNYRAIIKELVRSLSVIKSLNRIELFILLFIVFFILTAVAQKITWLDTQAYHAQNIQWIRTFAVVPGLGNLHDRFAFNSMFFVISALFTFQVNDILIFPLNGICYIVLVIKLFTIYSKEINNNIWKGVFYMLLLLVSLLTLIQNLNTPSPDIICAVLTIYVFLIILDRSEANKQLTFNQFVLLSLLIFTCVSYKISSLFLSAAFFLFLDKKVVQRSLIVISAAILIITPFLIRNYYLSGYLVYPFPAIDIFNVDWKIPMANVSETKSVIEGWARIPVMSYNEVLNMKFTEWIFPWFEQLSFYSKLLVIINLFSVITFMVMLIRKDFLLASVQFLIHVNLIFWFIEAPDLRFVYGFVFLGFSLSLAYLIKLIENSVFSLKPGFPRIMLAVFFLIIIARRIMFPLGTLREPSLWLLPASFETVETSEYTTTNFKYRIPVGNLECFYTKIPCVTYQLNDVCLRGFDLQDGFKVTPPIK